VMDFSFSCDRTVLGVGFSELVEGLLFVIPPTLVLLRSRSREPVERTSEISGELRIC
jgi:hypothetical protein